MGQRCLIDSNAIIDYTSGILPPKGSDFIEHIFDNDFLISVAARIEVLGYNDIPAKLSAMEEFVNTASVIHLDDEVVQQAILLRRNYRKLKLGDSIIAASAIVNGFTLITRNTADFKNVSGLKLLNLWDDI